ncbi:hypothetical protein DM02DRAFT_330907 [Periconia macrospinosa]|uniref:TNFR-Cys domain-containing protein n=1 Tax=Periconia macrospinosa TaxID=97972 RepID=A0A2V1D0X0_9PLEO|nr:hypothetical protein DM02DRAFT_330907 [Periconia macrospinosa]
MMRYPHLLVLAITSLVAALPSNGCSDECAVAHATCLNEQSALACYNSTCSTDNDKCKACPFCLGRGPSQVEDVNDTEPGEQIGTGTGLVHVAGLNLTEVAANLTALANHITIPGVNISEIAVNVMKPGANLTQLMASMDRPGVFWPKAPCYARCYYWLDCKWFMCFGCKKCHPPRAEVSSVNVDSIESSQVCLKDCYKDGKLQCKTKMCKMCKDCGRQTAVDAESETSSADVEMPICSKVCYKNGKLDCKIPRCGTCNECARPDSESEVSPAKREELGQCAGPCNFFHRCANEECRSFHCHQDRCRKCSFCTLQIQRGPA